MVSEHKSAQVNFDSLLKIFTVPEGPDSTLTKIDEELSRNLNHFLRKHIVAEEKPLKEIEKDFSNAHIPEQPQFVSDHTPIFTGYSGVTLSAHRIAQFYWPHDIGTALLPDAAVKNYDRSQPESGQN